MRKDQNVCTHLRSVKHVTPSAEGCVECLAMGDTWVHLRLCRTCGQVEPGKHWSWCFIDEAEVVLP